MRTQAFVVLFYFSLNFFPMVDPPNSLILSFFLSFPEPRCVFSSHDNSLRAYAVRPFCKRLHLLLFKTFGYSLCVGIWTPSPSSTFSSSLDFPMNVWHFESLSVSQGFLMTFAFCKEGSIHIQNKATWIYFEHNFSSIFFYNIFPIMQPCTFLI